MNLDPLFPVVLLSWPASLEAAPRFQVESGKVGGVVSIPFARCSHVSVRDSSRRNPEGSRERLSNCKLGMMNDENYRKAPLTVNPLLSPPRVYLFQAHLRGGGGLIEAGGLFERGGLFNLAKTMVSVLHKELEYKVEKLRSFRSCCWGSESNPNFQLVNKQAQISPNEVLQSWLINTVYHLVRKNN